MDQSESTKLRCSVGITAHNEEANIGALLDAMISQRLYNVEISEIIVVASGCTDRTIPIVQEYMARDPRIRLLVQERREGKTSAINLFLQHAREDICVLESGDTLPSPNAIESMVSMFADPTVGMTGAHKVPVNTPAHIVGYLSHLRLKMEHQLSLEIPRLGELSLEIPRLGELIAFRKVFDRIPPDVAMDEAFVEALSIRRGLQVRYAPDAVVYNMGPTTLADFIRQRRRNHAGHLHLKRKYGYRVSSLDTWRVLRVAAGEVWGAIRLLGLLGVLAGVELVSRLLGSYDYYIKGDKHIVWDMAWTTKNPSQNLAQVTGQAVPFTKDAMREPGAK